MKRGARSDRVITRIQTRQPTSVVSSSASSTWPKGLLYGAM